MKVSLFALQAVLLRWVLVSHRYNPRHCIQAGSDAVTVQQLSALSTAAWKNLLQDV